MSISELDEKIKSITEKQINEIMNSDAIPTEYLIQEAEDISSPFVDNLETKMIESKLQETDAISENTSNPLAASTVRTKTVSGSSYNLNTSGQVMYYISSSATWTYDPSTEQVKSISGTTDYGYDTTYFATISAKNTKGVSSSKSYGYYRRAIGVADKIDYSNLSYNFYMIADFKVYGDGTSDKNVTTLTSQNYNNYTWGDF